MNDDIAYFVGFGAFAALLIIGICVGLAILYMAGVPLS